MKAQYDKFHVRRYSISSKQTIIMGSLGGGGMPLSYLGRRVAPQQVHCHRPESAKMGYFTIKYEFAINLIAPCIFS